LFARVRSSPAWVSLTSRRSLVRAQYRPPREAAANPSFAGARKSLQLLCSSSGGEQESSSRPKRAGHVEALEQRNHNPWVGGSSPSSAIRTLPRSPAFAPVRSRKRPLGVSRLSRSPRRSARAKTNPCPICVPYRRRHDESRGTGQGAQAVARTLLVEGRERQEGVLAWDGGCELERLRPSPAPRREEFRLRLRPSVALPLLFLN
jgi:hypothetical protein